MPTGATRTLTTGKKSSSYAAKDFKRSHVKGLFLELCSARSLNQEDLIKHLNELSCLYIKTEYIIAFIIITFQKTTYESLTAVYIGLYRKRKGSGWLAESLQNGSGKYLILIGPTKELEFAESQLFLTNAWRSTKWLLWDTCVVTSILHESIKSIIIDLKSLNESIKHFECNYKMQLNAIIKSIF